MFEGVETMQVSSPLPTPSGKDAGNGKSISIGDELHLTYVVGDGSGDDHVIIEWQV